MLERGVEGFIAANYEVIRFIEHGSRCRPMMDYVPGELLIDRVRRCPDIEKHTLFVWFQQLLTQMEQYHKCRNQQCYRYINPYSVLVTQDEQILLLDLDAESNAFVLKNLQKRAMRNHFVKPIIHIKESTKLSLDLYGYAKTIQFILAVTQVSPSLTGREERRLVKIIKKCLNENPKKQYEEIWQIKRELPVPKIPKEYSGKKRIAVIVLAVMFILSVLSAVFYYGTRGHEENKKQPSVSVEEDGREEESVEIEDGLDSMEEELNVIEQYLLRNTVKENQEVIQQGERIQRNLLRYLAAAYDREERKEEALEAYRTLCKMETQSEYAETAYVRRIALETEVFEYGKEAVLTGKEAFQKFPRSEAIALEYAEAIWLCREISEEEKREQMQVLAETFSAVRESECYRNWKKEQDSVQEEGTEADMNEKNGA